MATTYRPYGPGMTINKDPDSVLDYSFDWTAWLGTDTISAVSFVCSGCTVTSQQLVGNVATAWVSGGTLGVTVPLTCRITTAAGRTEDRSINLRIGQS